MGWLSLAIWTPIVIGALLLLFGKDSQVNLARWIALLGSIVSFLVTLPLYTGFKLGTADMQFVENVPWIERFNVNYHLGIDGLSVWFVLLTAFITIIVVIAGWEVIQRRVNQYMASFLILSGIMMFEHLGWTEVAEAIVRAMTRTFANKTVTYDFERLMEGAKLMSCSEFGDAMISHM